MRNLFMLFTGLVLSCALIGCKPACPNCDECKDGQCPRACKCEKDCHCKEGGKCCCNGTCKPECDCQGCCCEK